MKKCLKVCRAVFRAHPTYRNLSGNSRERVCGNPGTLLPYALPLLTGLGARLLYRRAGVRRISNNFEWF